MKVVSTFTIICFVVSIQHGIPFTPPFSTKVATLNIKKASLNKNKIKAIPIPPTKANKNNAPLKEKASFNFQSFGISKTATAKLNTRTDKNTKVKPSALISARIKFPKLNGVSQPVGKKVNIKDDKKRNIKQLYTSTKAKSRAGVKIPELKVPELSDLSIEIPTAVGIAGTGMQLLKPLFTVEAKVQAGALVTVVDILGTPFRVYPDEIRAQAKKRVSSPKPILYTYTLSPFSQEAKKVLKPYDVEVVDVGPEWFLLGPEKSELRLALAENSEGYQTSLPHLFVKGESLGGLSTGGRNNAGILGLKSSGALDTLLKKRK